MERIKNLQSQINAHPLKYFGVFSLLSPEHQVLPIALRLSSKESKFFAINISTHRSIYNSLNEVSFQITSCLSLKNST